ncbi:MAG: hypothetical protein ACRDTD_21185, partial [Pseudonocardiaceae bacterium]
LSVAFGLGFLVAPGESADIQFYGLMLQDLPARNLVMLGIITGLIAAAGAESIRWGTARWRRRRRIARKKERELAAAQATDSTTTPSAADADEVDTPTAAREGSGPEKSTPDNDAAPDATPKASETTVEIDAPAEDR